MNLSKGPARAGAATTRREVLKGLAAAPVIAVIGAAPADAAAQTVLHRGWVLRADDLERLGRR
jgi:hypothetical protein